MSARLGIAALIVVITVASTSLLPLVLGAGTVHAQAGTMPATALRPSDATPPPQIDYRVSLGPYQIWDGTLDYFKAHGFTTVVLIAAEPVPYDAELYKIKEMGMYPILDLEHVIWHGGKYKSTPITQFDANFSMWQKAGWTNVVTEGGRSGDLDTLKEYFPKFTFFNSDQSGLWQDVYRDPYTAEMSWETYYPSEVSSIQQGALISYNLGKPQGITAGAWPNGCLSYDTYKSLLDWSYAESVGFTHFNVFLGLGGTLGNYQKLGLDTIVSQLQKAYPPKPAAAWPKITITSVRQVPDHRNALVWSVTNLGGNDAWIAPYAILHSGNVTLPGHVTGETILSQDTHSSSSTATQQRDGYGWARIPAGGEMTIVSPSTVPANATGAAYNAYVYYNNSSQGWLYSNALYTTIGCKPIPTNFLGLFNYSNADIALFLLLGLIALLAIALGPRLARRHQK